jgi:hypothetical protein
MPLDASIPLAGKAPQINDPMQAYGQMLSLRNMQVQQKMQQQEFEQRKQLMPLVFQQHQQQLEAGQQAAQIQKLKLAEAEEDRNDDKESDQGYRLHEGDTNKFLAWLPTSKISMRGQTRIKTGLQHEMAARTAQYTNALALGEKTHEVDLRKNNETRDKFTQFLKRTPEDMEANWSGLLEGFLRDGQASKEQYAELIKAHGKFPGREAVIGMRDKLNTETSVAADAAREATRITQEKAKLAFAKEQKDEITESLMAPGVTPKRYDEIVAASKLPAGTFPPSSAMFPNGVRSKEAFINLDRMMAKPESRMTERTAEKTADATFNYRQTTIRQRDDQLDISQQNADTNAKRNARETATARKNEDHALAVQALQESNANGGNWDGKGGYDAAIANVAKHYEGHEIGKNRGGVLRELEALKAADLRNTGTDLKNQAAQTNQDLIDSVIPKPAPKGAPGPTGPKAAPAAPTKSAAPPVATPPAAAPPAAKKGAPEQPKIPPAAQPVHDSLKQHRVPFNMIDSADGLPILEKDGKQYKVMGVDKDGNLKLQPGSWGKQ